MGSNSEAFKDFINGQSQSNAPDFIAGIKNGATVKVLPSSLGAIQLLGSLKQVSGNPNTGFNMNITTDQIINLSGGTKFIITDLVITNASTNLNAAKSFQINDNVSQTGNVIAQSYTHLGVDGALTTLQNQNNFVNSTNPINISHGFNGAAIIINQSQVTVGNKLYASLGTPQGVSSAADVYVYGYILQ